MSSNALARLGEEEGKCWAFGESCWVVPAEVAREVVVALQAERDALAAKLKDAEHDRDEFRRVMNGFAEKMAELEGQEPVAWQHRNGTLSCRCPEGQAGAYWVPLYARPSPAEPVEMSPDFTDTARSALLWVLWHHQGGSSPVGQPIRQALGMDAHERLSERQVQEAKKWAAISGAKTNDFHRSEPVNARLLEALKRLSFCAQTTGGVAGRDDELCSAIEASAKAIAAAEAQQERLLQDMHDAGREAAITEAVAPWKSAVIDQLVIAHILTAEHESDPLKALQDLLAYHTEIAVDPRVSGAAAGLVEQAKAEEREACAKVCESRQTPGTGSVAILQGAADAILARGQK